MVLKSVVLVPATLGSPGYLLEIQIQAHHRATESETLGVGPAICVLTRSQGEFHTCISLRTTGK